MPISAFDKIPKEELYIFKAPVPPPLSADKVTGAGPVPATYSYRMSQQEPIRSNSGTIRIVDSKVFPAAQNIAGALVEIEPGGMRELHWHPDADEMQYYLGGTGRMTVYASASNAGTFDFQGGDVGYVPMSLPHYVENTGTDVLRFLEIWSAPVFYDVSLVQWLAFTPFELVKAHFDIDASVLAKVSSTKMPLVGR